MWNRNSVEKSAEEKVKQPERVEETEEFGEKEEVQVDIRKGAVDSTLTRFFERMTKLEWDLDDQTQSNSKNLEAVMERTEKHFEKIQKNINKRAENVTEQIGELTSQMVEREERRDKAQRERDRELDKRDQELHEQTQKLLAQENEFLNKIFFFRILRYVCRILKTHLYKVTFG